MNSAVSPAPTVLIVNENESVPHDRRVWQEALTLTHAGYSVTVVCPRGENEESGGFEEREGVAIYRYRARPAAGSSLSYVVGVRLGVGSDWSNGSAPLTQMPFRRDPRLQPPGRAQHRDPPDEAPRVSVDLRPPRSGARALPLTVRWDEGRLLLADDRSGAPRIRARRRGHRDE